LFVDINNPPFEPFELPFALQLMQSTDNIIAMNLILLLLILITANVDISCHFMASISNVETKLHNSVADYYNKIDTKLTNNASSLHK